MDTLRNINNSDNTKLNRVMSGNLSVGIGIMMESVLPSKIKNKLDNDRVAPDTIDISKYSLHGFNCLTMVREAASSMASQMSKQDSTLLKKVNTMDFVFKHKEKLIMDAVKDDMNTLVSLYQGTNITPFLYLPDYTSIATMLNKDKDIKETKKIQEINKYMELSKKIFNHKNGLLCNTMLINKKINNQDKILLTTSYISDFHYVNGDLLEAHTGKLKDKHKLNTKFKSMPQTDLSNIPFNFTTHYIFGDNTNISPLPLGIRKSIYELSIEKKWSTHTNEDLIKVQIKTILK